jgi:hypothetical protein
MARPKACCWVTSADLARELPPAVLRGLREGHDPVGLTQVVRHLGFLEQHVPLHGGVAGFLSCHRVIRSPAQ